MIQRLARKALQTRSIRLAHLVAEIQRNSDVYDLKAEFSKLNKKVFGGDLKAVPMKWSRSSKRLGTVKASVKGLEAKAKELKLNDALLFNVDSTYSVEVFQDTVYQILEVGKTIKVPA